MKRRVKHLRDRAELLERFVYEVAEEEHWPDEAVEKAQEILNRIDPNV